jgi:NTE family protein
MLGTGDSTDNPLSSTGPGPLEVRMRPALPLLLASLLACGCAHTRVSCPTVAEALAAGVPASGGDPPAPVCPAPVDYPFTNLVLEGGGVKGIAYGGALGVLEQQGILPEVERVAGTSAGAITALLVALRYTPEQVRSLLFHIDFGQFEDGGGTGLLRLLRRYGWYRGDYYLGLMRCLVGEKTGNPRSTFADLQGLGMRELHVFTTDIDRRSSRELSFPTSPDFEVALAARMSGSFPLFFAAVPSDGDVYVDGGVQRNYPIDAFDPRQGVSPATIGLLLENTNAPPVHKPVRDLPGYAEGLLESLLAVQTDALASDLPDLERTAVLDDLGISTLDFHLSDAQKLALIARGEECTCTYLADWQRWQGEGMPSARLPAGTVRPIPGAGRCGSMFPP